MSTWSSGAGVAELEAQDASREKAKGPCEALISSIKLLREKDEAFEAFRGAPEFERLLDEMADLD